MEMLNDMLLLEGNLVEVFKYTTETGESHPSGLKEESGALAQPWLAHQCLVGMWRKVVFLPRRD